MRSLLHPNATAVLIRNNEPRFSSLEETIVNLERVGREVVEMTWGEVEMVDVEGDEEEETGFATVWTKFRIDLDGEVS